MKHLFTLFFTISTAISLAQPYFVDTLDTTTYPVMAATFELPNSQGYAVSTFANYDFNLIYTDLYGHRTGQKSWNLFDTLEIASATRNIYKLPNNNYLVALQVNNSNGTEFYGGLVLLNSTLTDTIWTKKYTFTYQNVIRPHKLFFIKQAQDGSIWILGDAFLNGSSAVNVLSHLSISGNIITQTPFLLSTGLNFASSLLPTADGGCIIGLTEAQNANQSTRQAAFVKVNAAGTQQWYKSYGNPNYQDSDPFVLKAPNPNEYWLIYHEGRTTANNPSGQLKAVRVDNAGLELESKYLSASTRHIYTNDIYQDADGSTTLAVQRRDCHVSIAANIWKFSPTLDSLWSKALPLPNYSTTRGAYPYHLIRATNGDYICAGQQYVSTTLDNIFLCRLDSMGCLVVGTEASPSPSRAGENIRIYPNPASDYINVDFLTENPQGKLYVYNAQGILITQINLLEHNTVISTTDWASGAYFYEYSVEGIVIQRNKLQIIH
jgi:Secretion system C-terminal sorting domain